MTVLTSLGSNSSGHPYLKLGLQWGDHIICPLLGFDSPGVIIGDMLRETCRMLMGIIANFSGNLLVRIKLSIIFLHLV